MFKKLGKKAKALGVVASTTVITSVASADVAFDATTKTLSGDIDMSAYYSAIPIVISVISAGIVVSIMLKMFGKSKSA